MGSAIFRQADAPCPIPGEAFRFGWLRRTDGSVVYFDVNGVSTSARGIADNGKIAGFISESDPNQLKGFVVELDDSPCQSFTIDDTGLITDPDTGFVVASSINNAGKIVGLFSNNGFIATPK